jgi:hypothetical protein
LEFEFKGKEASTCSPADPKSPRKFPATFFPRGCLKNQCEKCRQLGAVGPYR